MVLIDLQKVTQALGLVSSVVKPIPVVGGIGSGLIDTVGGVAGGTLGGSSGALNGLLGGGTGILAADVVGGTFDAASNGDQSGVDAGSNSTDPSYGGNSTDPSFGAAAADDSCAFEPYYPPAPVLLESFTPYDASRALIYRYRQQQSVNLGSWFVQEQWMVPSLFKCASGNKQAEYDVASGWGSVDNARQVLERHWDEWITESDFAYLASIGINTVRLPIGYWSLGPLYCQGTVFESVSGAYVNSWARVVRAINWAEKYGLGVLVDLHGAPGSQNAQNHGGTSDGQQNLFNNPTNIQLTINVLTYLTQQLVKVNNVVGIQILNEPSNVDSLPSFYSQVLDVLRKVSPEAAAFPFYIHDGFDLSRFADYISTRKDFVVLDHHSYFVFGDSASQQVPANQLTSSLAPGSGSVSQQIIGAATEGRRNIVVDEFSCALSGDALKQSEDAAGDRRRFCTGQMESYTNATAGYSFWSYKTEGCPDDVNWCFTSAVGNSLPATFFSYPNATVASLAATAVGASPSTPAEHVAADSTFLNFGTSMPSDTSFSPPTAHDWLESIGKDDSAYANINEALATTEYDMVPESDTDVEAAAAKPAKPAKPATPATPALPIKPSAPAKSVKAEPSAKPEVQKPKPAPEGDDDDEDEDEGEGDDDQDDYDMESMSTDTAGASEIPSVRLAQSPFTTLNTATVPSSRLRRNLLESLSSRTFLFASDLSQHRFIARHRRAASRRRSLTHRPARRDDAPTDSYTPEQAAISKGYADGWRAAKTFAAFGASRLGFTGQFMDDALAAMGSNKIVSGDEGHYKSWFMKGLADGEMQVVKMMALQGQGPQ